MARRTKLIAAVAGGVLIAVVAGVVFVYANLAGIVRSVLEEKVPGLTFKELDVGWNAVTITGVELKRKKQTVFKVDALRVYPSVLSIFSDTLHVASIEIDAPYVYVERNADGSLTLPVPEGFDDDKAKSATTSKTTNENEGSLAIRIDRIVIRDGKGELLDRSVTGAPARLKLTELQVDVADLQVPAGPGRVPFEISARLDGKRVGRISAEGWYDQATKSADAALRLEEIFVPLSEPYLRGRHTSAKLGDGALSLTLDLQMKEGAYTADTTFTLAALTFEREGLFLGAPTRVVKRLLKDGQEPIELKLKLEGRLDEKSKLQQQLLTALLQEVGKRAAAEGLNTLTTDAVKGEAGNALQKLFGR